MPTWAKVLVPVILGMLATMAVWVILPAMWETCDIGSGFARGWSLLVALPATFVVTVAATALTFAITTRIPRTWAGYFAVAASVVVAVVVVVVAIAQVYSSEGYAPSPSCRNGVPSWWHLPV